MLTERSIINFLIWTGGLILGPYLAITFLKYIEYNSPTMAIPMGLFVGVCALVTIFGIMRDRMCVLPVVGICFAGQFNFIPVLRPAPVELFPLMLIFYYFIAYFALQRRKMLTGPLYFFIPILLIALIVLYHEHSFGLRSMGNGNEGGRGAVFVLVAAVTYLCGVSVRSPSPRFLSMIPIFCIVVSIISVTPYIITTYFPGTAPFFYRFTSYINDSAYTADVLVSGDIVRNQGQAQIGATVMTFLLAYFPIYTWWRPHRWWVAIIAAGCTVLVVMGGYRSELATFGLTIFVAAWCYSGWRAMLLVVPVALGIFVVTALQDSHVIHLPESAQRTLAFLPGDWDPQVLGSTDSSNEFRQRIQHVYLAEDVAKSPLLGNGMSYNAADFERYTYLARYHEMPDGYYETESFVTSKMFHTGWISLYDAVGAIGFAFFLIFVLSLIWVSGRMALQKGVDHNSPLFPLKVWMFCNLFPSLVGYFTVFGDFKGAFPDYCYFAIIWTHLNRIEKFGYRPPVPVREVPFDPARTEVTHAA